MGVRPQEHLSLITLTAGSCGKLSKAALKARDIGEDSPLIHKRLACPGHKDANCICAKGWHEEHDPALAQPVYPDRFDYEYAALFNEHLAKTFFLFRRRLEKYLRRYFASHGYKGKESQALARKVSFFRITESQSRGVPHIHMLFRSYVKPCDLQDVVKAAISDTALAIDGELLTFGKVFDVREVEDTAKAANYVSKYVTKATEGVGVLLSPHLQKLKRACAIRAINRYPFSEYGECWCTSDKPCQKCRQWSGYARNMVRKFGSPGHIIAKSSRGANKWGMTLGEIREDALAKYQAENPEEELFAYAHLPQERKAIDAWLTDEFSTSLHKYLYDSS
jgi:hypothetical protein